jgi:hypothetical protein
VGVAGQQCSEQSDEERRQADGFFAPNVAASRLRTNVGTRLRRALQMLNESAFDYQE